MRVLWLIGVLGCAAGGTSAPASGDATTAADVSAVDAAEAGDDAVTGGEDTPQPLADTSTPDPALLTPGSVPVTGGVCCLGLTPERAVFQDGDGIGVVTASGVTRLAAELQDAQEPVLAGNAVIVSRGTAPERDLWRVDLATGAATPWLTLPGDQHSVTADGERVVWVDGTGTAAELWTATTDAPQQAVRLTNDDAEQLWPHVHGDQVVWTDMRNDPDKAYVGTPDDVFAASENNGDIYALTLGGEERRITDDLEKQARPAVEGDVVAWLDWRGISPEPKYKRFAIWARRGQEPELALGSSSWERPALWQRPAVSQGAVLWVRETSAGTTLQRQSLEGQPTVLANGTLMGGAAAAAIPGLAAWVTGSSLELLAVP